ncbi:hypothetical protein RFI_34785 [Reticulomyxa filosa]|nr:hypothetical protein RFI_34785 [Reticulomyxa filosa]|eukprot:ETO02633.1 hypothetical protein RFI_34785 [Reticulomyxa filosa]
MAFENFDVANLGTYFEEQDYVITSDRHKGIQMDTTATCVKKSIFMAKQIFWIASGFGVQLDNLHYNANDGTVNNKVYFVTKQDRGF